MTSVIQDYLNSVFQFYFGDPLFLVLLVSTIYIVHRAFYKVHILHFLRDTVIALLINHYLVAYMHVNAIIGLILTVAILPLLQLLLEWALHGVIGSKTDTSYYEPVIPRRFLGY